MLERAVVADVARPRVRTAPRVSWLVVAVMACVASIAVVAPTLLSAPAGTRRSAVPVFVIGVGVLFGLGLSDLVRARDSRFARAVVGAGAVWSLSALATSPESTLYSVGRVGYWLVNVALVYLLLSYPSGRLTETVDRALFGAVVIVVMLYLPTALIAQQFPSPSVWSVCICVKNTALSCAGVRPSCEIRMVVPRPASN